MIEQKLERLRREIDEKDAELSRLTRVLRRVVNAVETASEGLTDWENVAQFVLQAKNISEPRRFAISCVMDNQVKFRQQTLNWLAALKACNAFDFFQPYVHYIGPQPRGILDDLESMGAILVEIEAFGRGSAAYCNKLMQLETFYETQFEEIVLTDTDLAFLQSPRALIGSNAIRGKVVDHPNPSEEVLSTLLERAGFADSKLTANPDFSPGNRTHPFNCNGGLYIVPKQFIQKLGERWLHWSRFCLSQKELLDEKLIHSDQLGFMLAMIENGFPFEPLPTTANFPTHFAADSYNHTTNAAITALHYHDNCDEDGYLGSTGHPSVDDAIQYANTRLQIGRSALNVLDTLDEAEFGEAVNQ